MDISENAFETHIVEHLVGVHGYRLRTNREYDARDCLDWNLLLEFIIATQPEEWQRLERQHGTAVKAKFLRRLTRQVSLRGTLHVLRRGVKDYGCHFQLAYFRPATTLNPEHLEKYSKNILSVVRQLRFSRHGGQSLDIVIFLNGLPIFTIELKNKLTNQTSSDAIRQYQRDRNLQGEPLLQFKRCLAHFAVDGDDVYSTTHLQGQSTHFLPFNLGDNNGAGNPVNPDGYATSYFWEDVLAPEKVLELVGAFIHLQIQEERDYTVERLIFPRYHQWDVVRKLLNEAQQNGPGYNYLIQHSAGSGKSISIAWLAHRLSSLHDTSNEKIFSSIIIVTDRRVLDSQLRDIVRQFEQTAGVVDAIEQSSSELARALETGSPIIVTTLQKFPFVLTKTGTLSNRTFAIIADEAHSSQTGETSIELKAVLSQERPDMGQDPDMYTGEDLINRSMAKKSHQPNLSFFAFTATPKQKTLEFFGVEQPDGSYHPFHLYSMRQAIEEGFILDILQNYTTFSTYFKLLKTIEHDPRYPKGRAMSLMRRYVDLHEYTIAQKVTIMVEHFWENTRHQIPDDHGEGQAKAMIVTRSRRHTVRYKLALDKYLKQRGYPIKTLVAFSGAIKDPPNSRIEYTEARMNGFPEAQTASVFAKSEYRFMVVAEKFQTGFDQPLLHTMYVDKVLTGLAAVQTLSRLNRTHPRKVGTMILDFVNEAEHIKKAFQPYYTTTVLSEGSDPNKLYDLQELLEEFDLFTSEQVHEVSDLFLRYGEKASKLQPLLRQTVDKYKELDPERRLLFKSSLDSFVRQYAFLSQIMPFQDTGLERFYLFGRLLFRMLPKEEQQLPLDVEENIDLESYRLQQTYTGQIKLDRLNGEIDPLSEARLLSQLDPEQAMLSQIIAELNERFGTEFMEEDRVFFAEMKTRLANHESLLESAKVNSRDNVRLLFDMLFIEVLQGLIDRNFDMFKRINDDQDFAQTVRDLVFETVYHELI